MHLAIGTHADGTAFQVGDYFAIGDVLGQESDVLAGGRVHTHIEINRGVYHIGTDTFMIGNGVTRPMCTADSSNNITLDQINEGVNMSINPYPYLDRIWKSRIEM